MLTILQLIHNMTNINVFKMYFAFHFFFECASASLLTASALGWMPEMQEVRVVW